MAEIVEIKTDETSGREFYLYDNGMELWKDSGKIKAPPPAHAITPETARAMQQRGKMKGMIAQLRGLAKATGLELPADAELEQILEGAGDTLEALTVHFAKTFLKSSSLRGMAEGYARLAAPLVGDRPEAVTVNNMLNVIPMPESVMQFFADLHKRLKAKEEPEIIEGQEVDAWQSRAHGPADQE